MHLRAIKLRGFKSFVDPVEIRLEPGVAVVVGPNGSGKSNVSDSILWATGSMAPHELRAEKPDDVLFVGSAGRKPVDFCEVDLVFDNEDGAWPDLPYSEVSIARRLHRGGEGQYLVNRAAVRRIDLVELLSDVGLGGGLRSVISQGRVELVLASKPSERRELVEEAAGLGRFKRRRHRAELKLARVATQVERARDLEDEVRKRLRPLALQATAAERAEKLGFEIARLRAAIATLDLAALAERRVEAEARRARALDERRACDGKLELLLADRSTTEEELTDSAGAREAATAALYRLRSAAERIVLRRETAQALSGQMRAELEAVRSFDPSANAGLEQAARDAAAAAQAAAAERARLQVEAEERWARIAALERAAQSSLAAELDDVSATRAQAEGDLTGGARDALLALRSASQRVAVRQESAQQLVAELRRALAEAESYTRSSGPSPADLARAADETDAAARAAARERDDLAERARLAQDRLGALEAALAEREGLPPAARALAEEGERLALQLVDAEPGRERALAAALGHRASAVLADDAQRALELVERARSAGLGSVVVLVGRNPRDLVLPVVSRDELLASPVAAVTEEGIGWDPATGELWFAGETAEAVLLELEARRRELAAEVERLAGEATEAERRAAEATDRARAAAEALAPVAHLRHVRPPDATTIARVARQAERLDETLRVAAAVAGRVEDPLVRRTDTLAGDLRELAAREADLRRVAAEHDTRAREAERRANGRDGVAAGDPNALRIEAEDLTARAREAIAAADDAAERARAAARAVADTGSHKGRPSPLALARLADAATRLERALDVDPSRHEAPLRERVTADATRTAELGAELRRLGAEEVELRRTAGEAAERLSAIDVELARADAERDEAQRRLDAANAEPAEGEDRDELAEKLSRAERRRELLGQVNPLAKEEYEAEKERLQELTVQRADLEKSLDEIEKLRDDLTRTVETRFTETFDAVQRHFEDVAATLFPGGDGRLRLTEPEDEGEEPGIEVELRPAGKRITRLSLLSGGEKALGAIAFLFSLFLARPSPFYLLDEVEAALDDTNIGRFTELLRRYAGEAQFIVITHQKRTMEAADVLYGVTMGSDGVSQIVSRRLPREEAVATA